jgi:hypothetical protein
MKRIGLILLVLVFALGAMGAGYAYWSQSLNINGSVDTGELAVTFTSVASDDPALHEEIVGYDAASTVITNTSDTVTFTVTNAYPGYSSGATITVHNAGTIPVKLASAVFNPGANPAIFNNMKVDSWSLVIGTTTYTGTSDDFSSIPLNTVLGVAQNAVFDVNFSFLSTMPDSMENQITSFTLNIGVTQFNNPATPSPVP